MRRAEPGAGPGPLIASGRTAEVYAWDEGLVLKLMRPEFGAAQADEEARAARLAAEAGVGAPAFAGRVDVGGRAGLLYERLDGTPMVDALTARPMRVGRLAATFARLHAGIHAADADALPDIREGLTSAIGRADLDAATRRRVIERLGRLPGGDSLLHGDMHPANVILTDTGPRIIDWIQATRGAPAADLARTLFLVRGAGLPTEMPAPRRLLIGALRRAFASSYLRAYRRHRPLPEAEIAAWLAPVLAARLAEGVSGEAPRLHRLIRDALG